MKEMTLNEIREKGTEVLVRELGPIGYVRFMQQFIVGRGDYTLERRRLADSLTLEELLKLLAQARVGDGMTAA